MKDSCEDAFKKYDRDDAVVRVFNLAKNDFPAFLVKSCAAFLR
jgi:hypothetical protein